MVEHQYGNDIDEDIIRAMENVLAGISYANMEKCGK
jgi:hypothetical protein